MSQTTYLGGLSLSAVVPMLLDAANAIQGAAYMSLPELQEKIDALMKASGAITISPPSLTVLLDLVAQLKPLTISASVDFELMAKINVQLVGLYAFIALQIQIMALLASAGVHVWSHDGTMTDLKNNLPTAAPGEFTSTNMQGLLMLTSIPATFAAMSQIFKTS